MGQVRRLFVAAVLVLGSGCATVTSQKDLQTKKATVVAFSQMRFEPIALDKPVDIKFRDEDPIYLFPEGNSFFSAASLPKTPGPMFMTFRSYVAGVGLSVAFVVIPKFAFLDESKQLLHTAIAPTIVRSSEIMRGYSFQGRVQVPEHAAYVVIYAADRTDAPLTALSANGTVWPVPLSASGDVQIALTAQAVALVTDSGVVEGRSKAQLFVIAEVDGQKISNSIIDSRRVSSGTGFKLNTVFTSRELPARPMKVTLIGTHETGAPIHAIASELRGTFFSVKGEVDFTPVPGGNYVVKGELKKIGSSVWIEEAATGRVVTEKVVARGE